jgi:hypothetical protein
MTTSHLRLVHPDERPPSPMTEPQILAEIAGHMAEVARLAALWQTWALDRIAAAK